MNSVGMNRVSENQCKTDKFTQSLNIGQTVESLVNGDGHQIYLDSEGGLDSSCKPKSQKFDFLKQLMKLDLMNRLRRACEARNVLGYVVSRFSIT